jgi:hypothetical protein
MMSLQVFFFWFQNLSSQGLPTIGSSHMKRKEKNPHHPLHLAFSALGDKGFTTKVLLVGFMTKKAGSNWFGFMAKV